MKFVITAHGLKLQILYIKIARFVCKAGYLDIVNNAGYLNAGARVRHL